MTRIFSVRSNQLVAVALFAAIGVGWSLIPRASGDEHVPNRGQPAEGNTPHAAKLLSEMPMTFVENLGQWDEGARFATTGGCPAVRSVDPASTTERISGQPRQPSCLERFAVSVSNAHIPKARLRLFCERCRQGKYWLNRF